MTDAGNLVHYGKMKIELENGKYEVVFEEKTGELYANRYGKRWREMPGDKLALAMMHKIEELETELNQRNNVEWWI